MNGAIWDKKGANSPFWNGPQTRKEGYEERCLSCLFFQIVDKLLVSLTFLKQFTLSSAYLNMNFWTPFPFIADKITHVNISLPDREVCSICWMEYILEHKI
jgi:hypothetical protein